MLAGWRSLVQANECWQRLRVLLAHAPAGPGRAAAAAARGCGHARPGDLLGRRPANPASPTSFAIAARRIPRRGRPVRRRQKHAVPADDRRAQADLRASCGSTASTSRPRAAPCSGPMSATCRSIPACSPPAWPRISHALRRSRTPEQVVARCQGRGRARADPAPAQRLRHAAGRRRRAPVRRAAPADRARPHHLRRPEARDSRRAERPSGRCRRDMRWPAH